MAKIKQPKKPHDYSFSLTIGDANYKSTGYSILECLEKIKPIAYKAQGVLVTTHNGKEAIVKMKGLQMKQLFAPNKLVFRQLMAKRMEILL